MSELMNARNSGDFRWQLLTTVSALALLGLIYGPHKANAADDSDHPTFWIELGGQLEQITGQGENFALPFVNASPNSAVFKPVSPLQAEKPPAFSYGAEGKISYEPDGTNWIFDAAIRYGRSGNKKHTHEQTFPKLKTAYPTIVANYPTLASKGLANYADTLAPHSESHAVVDFQAGKDFGIGLFGRDSTSILSVGVRFAQFSSVANVKINARPDIHFYPFSGITRTKVPIKYDRNYVFRGQSARNFHGIGPSLSWNASAPVVGNPNALEVSLDWGANAAVLFGRQKATTQHQTTARKFNQFRTNCCSHTNYVTSHYVTRYKHGGHSTRTRSVTVPNFGAFMAVSVRRANAKISLGYRADFFFGAVDGGIDTARGDNLGFYGPFATISIGFP